MARSRDLGIDKTIGDVIASVRKPKLEPETGWYTAGDNPIIGQVPFEGDWGNAGTVDGRDYPGAAWYLSHHGEVRHKGVVTGGSVGDTILILPEEYRIEERQVFACSMIGGGTANILVDTDGSLIVESIS